MVWSIPPTTTQLALRWAPFKWLGPAFLSLVPFCSRQPNSVHVRTSARDHQRNQPLAMPRWPGCCWHTGPPLPNGKTHVKVAHAAVCETARQHLLRDDNDGKRKSPGRRDDKFASLSIYKQYLWHLRLAVSSPALSLDLEYTSIPLPRISHIRVPCLPGQSAARRLYTSSYCK